MSNLIIDGDELTLALESYHDEIQYVLDCETGEVIPMPANGSEFPIEEDLKELIDQNLGTRFIGIEPLASHESWQVMNDFIEQLPSGDVTRRLIRALEGKSPFRRFKDVLLNYPTVRDEWFKFHEDALFQLAREWLKDNSIDATLKRIQRP